MNVEKLRAVKEQILAEPRKFNMGVFLDPDTQGVREAPPCGTVACIAGWGVINEAGGLVASQFSTISDYFTAMSKKQLEMGVRFNTESVDYYSLGKAIFELTDEQANALFYDDNWPEPFNSRYQEAYENRAGSRDINFLTKTAQIAADRIEHMIATGE